MSTISLIDNYDLYDLFNFLGRIEFGLTATQQLWLYRAAPERGEGYIGNPLSNFYGSLTCPEDRL